ncbi:MAG: hypothetical protein WCP06_14115, partial [Verrucomicrobiota bacterium]
STTRRDPRRKPSFKSGLTRLIGFTGLQFSGATDFAGSMQNPSNLENHVNPVEIVNALTARLDGLCCYSF